MIMFFFATEDDHRRGIGWCYEILAPSRDASHDNPPLNMPKPLPPHHTNTALTRAAACVSICGNWHGNEVAKTGRA